MTDHTRPEPSGDHPDRELIERHCTMLANRLRKRIRFLRRWARREQVTAWRLYDGDIPELPLAIDWYDGLLHIHVAHGRGGYRLVDDPDRWVDALVATTIAIASELLEPVDPATVIVKHRRRQRVEGRGDQYERRDEAAPIEKVVVEDGLRFFVELATRHDTGLFLDHRQTRHLVRQHAAGLRVLNLFAYTGAFTVYAAAGGARSTVSVDLSKNYLEWAQENLAENGFDSTLWTPPPDRPRGDSPSATHLLVRADVEAFLALAAARHWRYGLAIVDPPTFSTSKQAEATFDVQRDHVRLLKAVAERMEPLTGAIVFSSNRRRFELELRPADLPQGWRIEEITARTVPPDFRGQPHRAWLVAAPEAPLLTR